MIRFCLRNPLITLVIVGAALAWGWSAWTDKTIDAIPDISENQTVVLTEWPGRSPQDVEDLAIAAEVFEEREVGIRKTNPSVQCPEIIGRKVTSLLRKCGVGIGHATPKLNLTCAAVAITTEIDVEVIAVGE